MIKRYFLTVAALAALNTPLVMAEFKYADTDADNVSRKSVYSQSEAIVGLSDDANQSAQFDKSKLLRCWQEGRLIVAENGWNISPENAKLVMSQGPRKMSLYDYGETFCMYLGEQ